MAGLETGMAAAGVKFDLATVKRVTQQMSGFEKAKDPIFEWRLTIPDLKTFQSTAHSSDSFRIIPNGDLLGQLQLTYSTNEYTTSFNSVYKVSLHLTDSVEKNKIGQEGLHPLNPLQFFVCNVKTNYYVNNNCKQYEHCVLNLNADENGELNCKFNVRNTATNLTVELYEETLAVLKSPWPYDDVIVGKIENFCEKMLLKKLNDDDILSVSPTFHFGSPQVMVKFSKVPDEFTTTIGLSATLHILGANGISELPSYYVVTFTIFSQRKENNVKDLVRKVFFFRQENKNDFSTLLAFYHDLIGCHDDGHLYYKVLVEPHSGK